MLLILAVIVMPLFLVFGLYHLVTWINLFNINKRVYWKRVALSCAISHLLLATGFFIFCYVDYRMSIAVFGDNGFDSFLFNRSEFWRLLTIFDTAPTLALLGILAIMDRTGLNFPILAGLAFGVTYIVGTIQWYFAGGGIGLLVERFWSGIKKGQEDEDWF